MLSLLAAALLSTALPSLSPEEELAARRIVLLWRESEYELAEQQMTLFGRSFPRSPLVEQFEMMRGDHLFAKGCYLQALEAYNRIRSDDIQTRCLGRAAECFYQTKQYSKLREVLEEKSSVCEKNERLSFYHAEALRYEGIKSEIAERIYRQLLQSPYRLQARLALATMAQQRGDFKAAVASYLRLAEESPDQKEEWLLIAARLSLSYSPEQALELFTKAQGSQEDQALASALGQLWLLYEQGNYETVLARAQQFKHELGPSHSQTFEAIVGKAYFACQQYEKALALLEPLLELRDLGHAEERQLLLTALMSAHQLGKDASVAQYAKKFEFLYAQDEQLPKVLLLFALAQKRSQQWESAARIFQNILEQFPHCPECETVYLEQSLLGIQRGELSQSRKKLEQMLHAFPQGALAPKAREALALITIQQMESLLPLESLPSELQGQLAFLKNLCEDQEVLPRTYVALGYALEAEGRKDEACAAYRQALQLHKRDRPLIRDCAQRQLARLLYASEPQASLELLKQLEPRRKFEGEPLYLEAAYEYAQRRGEQGQPLQEEMTLLRAAKETFTSQDDIVSKDYQAQREKRGDKERLYQAYLLLFDARIAQLESLVSQKNGEISSYRAQREAAKELYQMLAKGEFAVSKYLVDQAQLALQEMRTFP